MNRKTLVNVALCAAMLSAAVLAKVLSPTVGLSDQQNKINLEKMIPLQFGEWKLDTAGSAGVVNPEVAASLSEIYSQTLSRTYVNASGDRIMLSVAYGDNQSRQLQVHRPEVCYSAQGFTVGQLEKQHIDTAVARLPVMQLVAQQGARVEPITYWVLIGKTMVRGNVEQGIARLRYGLSGYIADGLLFRVSTISPDKQRAYALEQTFVARLLTELPPQQRVRLIGDAGS
jgi:EpsI family protein